MPVFSGPANELNGANWNFEGPGVGGPLLFINGFPVPDLKPYIDRTQLTKDTLSRVPDPSVPAGAGELGPTLSPRPHADERSRGTWASLVFSALSLPGTDQEMLYPVPPDNNDKFRGA